MDQLSKVLDSLVLLYAKLRTIEIYLNLDAAHLLLRYLKLRKKKTERGLELVSLLYFLHDFLRKIFVFLLLPNQIIWYRAICVLQLFANQVVTSLNLKLTLS